MHNHTFFTDEQDERSATIEENESKHQGEGLRPSPETILPAGAARRPASWRPSGRKQLAFIAVVISLLLATSALLLPILLAQPGQLATLALSAWMLAKRAA